MKQYIEAGKIVNTHGVKGLVKIQPWSDSPDFLSKFSRVFIDGVQLTLLSSSVHKGCILASLSGITDIEAAVRLKNKIVYIDRNDAQLEPGEYFIQDLIGLTAIDADTKCELGKITDVISMPAQNVYVISGKREILIPGVSEFIINADFDSGTVTVRLIEGL